MVGVKPDDCTPDPVYVASAVPLTFIGDSHTLAYADLVFADRTAGGATYVTRSHYCRGILASEFCDAQGGLQADVAGALVADGFVERTPAGGFVARHRAGDLHAVQVGIAMERARVSPVLVFAVGDIDLRYAFVREFARQDFALPASYSFDPAPFASYAAEGSVPYALAAGFARKLLAPYFRGLVALARLGFSNVYLHAYPPQTPDDAAFERGNGFAAPARLRYKATRLFNAILREFVTDYPEFRLVDTWDRVTRDGVLDPQFHLDDAHLNRRAAALSVAEIVRDLRARTARAAGDLRPAEASDGGRPDVRAAFARDGVFALTFAADPAGGTVAAGWAGDPLGASRLVVSAPVAPDLLVALRALADWPETGPALAACVGAPPVLLNARAVRHRVPPDPALGVPPLFPPEAPLGLVRGLLYLAGIPETAEPAAFTARSGAVARLRPPAGTLVLYDPARIDHREAPGAGPLLDLLFAPQSGRTVPPPAGINQYWPLGGA